MITGSAVFFIYSSSEIQSWAVQETEEEDEAEDNSDEDNLRWLASIYDPSFRYFVKTKNEKNDGHLLLYVHALVDYLQY